MSGDNDTQLIQAKMATLGLDQTPEEFVAGLAPPVRRRVEALQELQAKHDELEAQFRKERAELEAKYEKLYAPLYVERSEIVVGSKEVPPKEGEPTGDDAIKGIPEFWLAVLLKCEVTMDMIKDKDMDVLKYLRDIQAEGLVVDGVSHGFKLRFLFDSNPYFTNEVLEKTYHMLPEDDGVLERAEGTKIEWNAGKDVTVKIMKKKPKKGGKGDSKPQVKTERVDSFFNFFDPPQVPDGEEEIDEDTMEELQAIIEADYEVGATIREKLIPEAVSWYTGEAMDEDGLYMPGDDDEDDEDFEGEEGEEDEDEDEEGAGAGEGQAAGGQAQPPECKQQ
ncbi:hypothetical protein CHLRE_09g416350v5 [Chlamydomonas reinhardtii]|uniref:Uncharacterized protein n=1 Tax=Chlamydomonas reinhardtii TaxID=3055 RepID=A8J513_CHLRE|nr:uncharacterized protein CHLRE_09g416350v5 [Chlamydomonas reinhardtii]PNW79469.1 hypothetical protein CHLRE_09g416350v5 [Chlamydomonas reinhardtii]|eukprot:XP_001696755.1 nucleosome assembly protein [Chlamydomonas reinhardtii]